MGGSEKTEKNLDYKKASKHTEYCEFIWKQKEQWTTQDLKAKKD